MFSLSYFRKKKINWNERKKELIELCNKYRRKDGYPDCIVPGSGGKDSFYAAHKLKYEFNMNPLTITYSHTFYILGDGIIFNRGFIQVLIIIYLRQMERFIDY